MGICPQEDKRMKIIIVAACLVSAMYGAERIKAMYKITRLSTTEVGISCTNGADPTGTKFGDTTIISCGK